MVALGDAIVALCVVVALCELLLVLYSIHFILTGSGSGKVQPGGDDAPSSQRRRQISRRLAVGHGFALLVVLGVLVWYKVSEDIEGKGEIGVIGLCDNTTAGATSSLPLATNELMLAYTVNVRSWCRVYAQVDSVSKWSSKDVCGQVDDLMSAWGRDGPAAVDAFFDRVISPTITLSLRPRGLVPTFILGDCTQGKEGVMDIVGQLSGTDDLAAGGEGTF